MPPDEQDERDAIFTLLALSSVHATWDPTPLGEGTGHNIGAILVDKQQQPIRFERNESTGRRDLTEHAELRVIRAGIAASPDRTELHKHSIYSTLEPCVMCAGMMAMTNINRAVYALPDPLFGGVFERLEGYPKKVANAASPEWAAAPITEAFARSGHLETIQWLPTTSAKEAFRQCAEHFQSYRVAFETNSETLEFAQQFLSDLAPQ